MKNSQNDTENRDLGDYIYIRLTKSIKKKLKRIAKEEGSNMTIWVRQLVMKELEARNGMD